MSPTVSLLGVPWDGSSSYLRGAALGPAAIREALWSPSSNAWTERGIDLDAARHAGSLVDAGDADPGAAGSAMVEGVRRAASRILDEGRRVLALGGDHSVTWPLVSAQAEHGVRPAILHVDAHADLYDVFDGDRFSHACPFARIMEAGLASRLVQVGIRTLTAHQRAQAARFGVEIVEMRDWRPDLALDLDGPVYVSLDLDGLDPAFAPGVSHREPGGLSVREVLGLLSTLHGPVVGADIVELNPSQDWGGMTAQVAAKLVKELSALIRRGPAAPLAGLP
jgi:arginase